MLMKKSNDERIYMDNSKFPTLNSRSRFCFTSSDNATKKTYRPLSYFYHPFAAVVVMAVCGMVDIVMFYMLFSNIILVSGLFRMIATLALFIGFDFGPIYLGMKLREYNEGYNIDKLIFTAFVIAFLVAFAASAYLRIAAKDIALPLNSFQTDEVSPLAFPWAIFGIFAPVVTSFVSFGISYCTYNRLTEECKTEEEILNDIEEEMINIRAAQAEDQAENDRALHLDAIDQAHYESSLLQAKEQGIFLCDYVRERLKEHLGNPSSTNELSKAACHKIMHELEQSRQMIVAMDPPFSAAAPSYSRAA